MIDILFISMGSVSCQMKRAISSPGSLHYTRIPKSFMITETFALSLFQISNTIVIKPS